MGVTPERFNMGMTYEESKAVQPRNLPQYEAFEKEIQLTDTDLAPWRALPEKYNVLVLVIDPCPDVQLNVPLLDKIAKQSGKLNVRVFMRDDNKDLMAQFMNGPYESVPVFAFFDQNWNCQSVFIERPKSVTELRAQKTKAIYESDPAFGPNGNSATNMPEDVRARFQAARSGMSAETRAFYVSESIRELREIAEELASKPSSATWRGNLAAVPA